ncbi:MAG TPA: MOSC domain-containing protein [Candidatus Binatia bacterium]|jgi:MOSC domain-containing protein YiiM
MHLVSVNIGLPRVVAHNAAAVTGIFKAPVAGRVRLRTLNLDGDRQADLSVHGGTAKAVYVYPAEHYLYWRGELPGSDLSWGMFGENFTTVGIAESNLAVGDKLRVGSAVVMVTEPRMPCYKLAIRLGRPDIVKRFLASERTGFYLSVLQEGEVGAGDAIELIEKRRDAVTIRDITKLYTREKANIPLLRRAIEAHALPESRREYFRDRLTKTSTRSGRNAVKDEVGGCADQSRIVCRNQSRGISLPNPALRARS